MHDMPSEVPEVVHLTPQHRYLHATIVIKVDVHRRNRQIMVLVRAPGQPLRQFAIVMIVDVDECCHAWLWVVALLLDLGNSRSSEIADCLRSVLIPALDNEVIERRHELVVNGDCKSLHFFDLHIRI